MDGEPMTIAERLKAGFDRWFAELQALTNTRLEPEEWTGRWFDGFTPAEALPLGPEQE